MLHRDGLSGASALALIGHQWGFLLLEGAWSAMSAMGLARNALR
jgi:hypothetical protein